jgi:hypothetical protein
MPVPLFARSLQFLVVIVAVSPSPVLPAQTSANRKDALRPRPPGRTAST